MTPKRLRRLMDNISGSTTFVGEGTKFVGELSGDGHFVICGEVEGDCKLGGAITVAVNGTWTGKIHAKDVLIAGTVNGEIKASGNMELVATARVTGSISGSSIAIAEGAIIHGEMNVASGDASRFAEKRRSD